MNRIFQGAAPTQCACLIASHVKSHLTHSVSVHVLLLLILALVFQKISKSHPASPIGAHFVMVLAGYRTSMLHFLTRITPPWYTGFSPSSAWAATWHSKALLNELALEKHFVAQTIYLGGEAV